jgi:hypothetical protein
VVKQAAGTVERSREQYIEQGVGLLAGFASDAAKWGSEVLLISFSPFASATIQILIFVVVKLGGQQRDGHFCTQENTGVGE